MRAFIRSRLRSLVERFARAIAAGQRTLFRRSAFYRRLMGYLARQLAFVLSGDPGYLGPRAGAAPAAAAPATPKPADAPARIQVHRRSALGDALLITPLLRALRERYPDSSITVSTLYTELFECNPNARAVVRADAPLEGFDRTFDLQYEHTPELHIVDAYARLAGVEIQDKTPELYLGRADLDAADQILRAAGIDVGKPLVGFHLESGWAVRNWPLERFRTVARALRARGVQVAILGDKEGPAADFGVDLRGRTRLRELAAVVFKCTALVTIDSGVMHIATAMRRPCVSLFGCTDPEKRLPAWAMSSAIYADVVCRGCHHRQRPVPVTTAPVCPFNTLRCMQAIRPDAVLAKLEAILQRQSKPALSVIIPHFGDHEVLDRCLASLFRNGAEVPFEVIVVDDSGAATHPAPIEAWAPHIRLVRNHTNFGFARSCNVGARMARGKFIVLLNNDTTVTAGWLDRMLDLYESDPRTAIVGPKLLYPGSGLIQHCGTAFNEQGIAEHLYRFLPGNLVAANRVRRFRALTGACMLMRRKDFLDVGGFDESYRNGGEDTDLCLRFVDRGRSVLYCPRSVVFHYEGYSRGLRGQDHPDDVYNRERLRRRWEKYLASDISDYCLLAEIEAGEGRTWRALDEVPAEIRDKYNTPEARAVGRFPFRCEIGSGMSPQPGYLHVDLVAGAPSLDVLHDLSRPLPFLDGTVNEILANHVVEHVSWRVLPRVVADFYRVTARGGKVFIRTPNLRFIAERFLAHDPTPEHPDDEKAVLDGYGQITAGLWANIKLFSGQDYPSNFHFLCMDPEDLAGLFRKAGFSRVSLEPFGREFSPGEIQLVAEK